MWFTRILCQMEKPCSRKNPMHSSRVFGQVQPSPDRQWKRRRAQMMTAHLFGRRRQCYRLSMRANLKELQLYYKNVFVNKEQDRKELRNFRVESSCAELDFDGYHINECLTRAHVALDQDMLAHVAIWEPRTFRSLVAIAAKKAMDPKHKDGLNMIPCGPKIDVLLD